METYLSRPILAPRQTTEETQIYLASRVKPMPPAADAAGWEKQAAAIRAKVLDNVIFRGEAVRWRNEPVKVEWLRELPASGYRLKTFRYQILPGMWLPGLLYEPLKLSGKVPVVVNLNGHEGEGMATSYIQERCVHLARQGVLAFNYEWFSKGQLNADGYSHARMNQLDLAGTSGIAPFFLAQQRLLDIALQHPNADAERVAVTGLSGGGWQTIFLSSLDTRVKLAVPVAGYSSFVTRTQFPDMDLGDSEQTPTDLAVYADYTHLTAMLAPRPSLLVFNARDNCCFRADYAVAPLLVAVRPFFALFDASSRLRHHSNFDAGHNYGPDNRRALYRFLNEQFFGGREAISEQEAAADVRKPEQLRVALPEGNEDLHTLAVKLSAGLPKAAGGSAAEQRRKLREVVRWPEYTVRAEAVREEETSGLRVRATRLVLSETWTVPVLELEPAGATGTTVVIADGGRAAVADEIQRLLDQKQRVAAIDPFYFGESRMETRDYLWALLVSAVGERPIGIQASQVATAAQWLKQRYGPVTLAAFGPRTSTIALVAGAVEKDAIRAVSLSRGMESLREPIVRNMAVTEAPELFCFGLAESFDVPQLKALAGVK